MAFDLLITGGLVATPEGTVPTDIGVTNGTITALGDLRQEAAKEILDATHLTVLPGVIDTQVHFREPGFPAKEDLESGTRAAILGGVTTVLEMPNTDPTTTSAEALADKRNRAEGRVWCDIGFFVGASTENLDQLAEFERLPGTPGIKLFMGSSTGSLLVAEDDDIRTLFQNVRRRVAIHAEDEARNRRMKAEFGPNPTVNQHPLIRDAESAILATQRVLRLAHETGAAPHILHISTADEPALIEEAKQAGIAVTCEVTPQHLWFSADDYARLGSHLQMNPPIRSAAHRDGLWAALAAGIFDVFGSDHAPHTLDEKAKPYPASPSGMPGVQTTLPVLLTYVAQGRLSLATLVKMACERPAELYGIAGKGKIAVGYHADFAIVDPTATYTFERSMVASRCGWSPYEGEDFTGRVVHTLTRGVHTVREGALHGAPSGQVAQFVG
jgi:dihydroorotase